MLRIEIRHLKTTACRQLKQKYKLAAHKAHSLLSGAIAYQELSSTLSALGFDKEILKYDSRIDRLRECYGDKRLVRPLVAFLALSDTYGDDFWRLGIAEYSKSLYYEHRRLVKKANALLFAEKSLPPLCLSPEIFATHVTAVRL